MVICLLLLLFSQFLLRKQTLQFARTMHCCFLYFQQIVKQPRKPGSLYLRTTAKTLVAAGHMNPQILGVI